MTAEELAERVRDMRKAQRDYFRERTPERLDAARRAERAIDALVGEILTRASQTAQKSLFGPYEASHE